jgi:hypothetical protein
VLADVLANAETVESEIRRIAGERAVAVRWVASELARKLGELEAVECSVAAFPIEFLRVAAVHADLAVSGDVGVGIGVGACARSRRARPIRSPRDAVDAALAQE